MRRGTRSRSRWSTICNGNTNEDRPPLLKVAGPVCTPPKRGKLNVLLNSLVQEWNELTAGSCDRRYGYERRYWWMGTFGLFFVLSWLMGSTLGRLVLAAAALWYVDNRYLGLLAGLMAPVLRAQRVAGLRRTVEINPSDVRAMVELGEHYLKGGRPQIAAAYLERALDAARTAPGRSTYWAQRWSSCAGTRRGGRGLKRRWQRRRRSVLAIPICTCWRKRWPPRGLRRREWRNSWARSIALTAWRR